jgi:hypothetical protein
MYSHLTDEEFLTHIDGTNDPIAVELARRLHHAVELIDDMEDNLHLLAAKYKITEPDLIECELS